MVEIEVHGWRGDAAAAVAEAATALGLTVNADGFLRKYPESRHWHLKKPSAAGTLEVTVWPNAGRLWVSYHSNRHGDGWVSAFAPLFAGKMADLLAGCVSLPSDMPHTS